MDAHHRLRGRQGPRADRGPTASSPTSPPTPPTTSTSASAASTPASTCGRRPPRLRRPAHGDGRVRRRRPRRARSRCSSASWSRSCRTARSSSSPSAPARSSRCEELVDVIGVDALRYTLARYPADSPLTLDVDEMTKAGQRQPRVLRAVRARPSCAMLRNAADLGLAADLDRLRPVLLVHEREGDLLAPSPSSRGSSPPPPSCASRTGSPATSRTRPDFTSSTTRAGCCPRATRGHRPAPGPARAGRRDAHGVRQRLDLLGVSAPERM